MDRRGFLAACAAVPVVSSFGKLLAAQEVADAPPCKPIAPELLALVHPDMRLKREPVPPDENAWTLWAEAAKAIVPTRGPDNDERLDDDIFAMTLNDAEMREGERGKAIRAWLDKNRRAAELLDAGLERGKLQFPEAYGYDSLQGTIEFARNAWKLKNVQARVLIADVRFSQAVRELCRSIRMGALIDQNALLGTNQLMAVFFFKDAGVLGRIVRNPHTSSDDLDALRAAVELAIQHDGSADAVRGEYYYYALPLICRIVEGPSTERLVDSLIDYWTLGGILKPSDEAERRDLAQRRKGLVQLLDAHPRPFDKADTVRTTSRQQAQFLRRLHTPWPHRSDDYEQDLRKEVAVWPPQFSFAPPDFLLAPRKDSVPPEEREVVSARDALRKVVNPVGKMLLYSSGHFEGFRRIAAIRDMHLRASQLVLAIEVFRREHTTLPVSLGELVDKKFLAAVPIDPFAGKPFGYSLDKRRFWSVGPEGKNDGGDEAANDEANRLYIWRL